MAYRLLSLDEMVYVSGGDFVHATPSWAAIMAAAGLTGSAFASGLPGADATQAGISCDVDAAMAAGDLAAACSCSPGETLSCSTDSDGMQSCSCDSSDAGSVMGGAMSGGEAGGDDGGGGGDCC